MWDEDFEGMSASLAAHDRILLEAIADHHGYVFSTAGDSYGAAFATAGAAVAAAVQAQLGLRSERWSGPPIEVRMGVHTGASEERAGNYFGPDVNRGARVMSAANGGQILLSSVTASLLSGDPDVAIDLADRGTHSLKDLERPEHLFEVRHPGLPQVDAPLHTVSANRLHVPEPLTSFVGREGEVERVTALLASSRLVTLTGVGGTGKTRLSMEVGARVQERFPDGVWMVELAPVTDPELVVGEVADLWHLRAGDGASIIEVVKAHLAARTLLLIIDNCEHVLSAASEVVADVLAAARDVSVLATSRESLGVHGEAVFRVPSLGLPADDSLAVSSDAVKLFLDRAERVRPGFGSERSDLAAVVRICRRLDGIPLGIELAAARLRTLGVGDLANRLDDSFKILTGGSKTAVPRQRTLQTAIDWSYELLDDAESGLFRRLSVFSGGFDLESAEAIGIGDEVEAWQVLDLIDQLVDKSLVVATHGDGGSRFRLLEPIRQYAQERLMDHGESHAVHLAHARYFAALVAEDSPRLRGPEQRGARAHLQLEFDNVRSALTTLLEEDPEAFFTTCFDLIWFWTQSSLLVEGRELLRRAFESVEPAEVGPSAVAKGAMVVAHLSVMLTDPKAVTWADRGVVAARESGDDVLLGWLLLTKAMASAMVGTGRDPDSVTEALELLSGDGLDPLWGRDWDEAALVFFEATSGGDDGRSRQALTQEAVSKFHGLGDRFMAAQSMISASFVSGQEDWLLSSLREAADILRDLDAHHGLGHALFYLGARRQDFGVGASIEELSEGASLLAAVGDLPCSTWSAARLIGALIDDGALDSAGRQLGETARRLLAFEREVHSDIDLLAGRYAAAVGDFEAAAWFLGSAEARGESGTGQLRATIAGSVSDEELAGLAAEGAAAGHREALRRIEMLITPAATEVG